MRRRHHRLLCTCLLLAALLAACTSGAPTTSQTPEPSTTTASPDRTATEAAEATPTATAVDRQRVQAAQQARLTAEAEREAEARARREEEQARREAEEQARRRAETTRVQEVLAAHGYYAGAADGEVGPATRSAVMAFQKVQGLARDGAIGPQTLAAIDSPSDPPLVGGAATRVEVDLDRQVVHLVRDGQRVRTMNASSGNGEAYTWPDGRRALADTPVGTFVIERRIDGLREGDLGAMYDPLYFHQGWAIHGSNHVPAHPASHGCVRLSRSDARWLGAQVPNGTEVVVHGSTNAFDPATESVWL